MNKLTGLTCIGITLPLLAALSGCSTTKSAGEIMLSQGEGTAELGKQWLEGESLVKKGEKLIRKGKSSIEDGEEMIDEGKEMIDDGEEMMEEGEAMIKRGNRLMLDSEEAYSKRGLPPIQ
ncbi:MAG: hypothetical protein KDI43_13580 [Gammaproteobacteria bacterium]|nr:hypothetical protein [Gammaproteobacteria bacterium]MCP5441747.1 hypothetical protein [Chromatiaceae bacterium]